MKLILLGAPGAGKGTHAEVICEKLQIPAVSTGNILREAVKNQTQLGKKAKGYMDAGDLVPDQVVIDLLRERIAQDDCKNGFILDGFPRTVAQAEALEKMGVAIDKVIDLEVEDDVIKERLTGRRVCASCGAPYHTSFRPPHKDGVCDKCGGEVMQRKDDKPETVADRLRVYHQQTEPLIDFYKQRGRIHVVKGQKSMEDTSQMIFAALEA